MSDTIKMDVDKYNEIVTRMKSESRDLLANGEMPAQASDVAMQNVVVPDYQVAHEEMLDTIRRMQGVISTVGNLMDFIRVNYDEEVDQKKSSELEQSSEK